MYKFKRKSRKRGFKLLLQATEICCDGSVDRYEMKLKSIFIHPVGLYKDGWDESSPKVKPKQVAACSIAHKAAVSGSKRSRNMSKECFPLMLPVILGSS